MNAYGELNSTEIGWAQERLEAPPLEGITLEEIEQELETSPYEPELLRLHTLMTIQSLTER